MIIHNTKLTKSQEKEYQRILPVNYQRLKKLVKAGAHKSDLGRLMLSTEQGVTEDGKGLKV